MGVAAVGWLLLAGDESYRLRATFTNASQLVKGNLVTVAGEEIGSVDKISLTDNGRARVDMTITKDGYTPLHEGTRATIRQLSLSGVANRYVELQLGGADRPEIEDGGEIPVIRTQANVELDQLFNTFDPKARKGFRGTVKLFSEFNAGREEEAQAALEYLNPSLASSTRLFGILNRNRRDVERFIVETSKLVTDVAARGDDVAGLVKNLSVTMDALADERGSLGRAVGLLPTFMRRANSTFVNLRATLDDVDPLVRDATPVVRDKLIPLFDQLRPFARNAAPTVRDLSRTIRRPGSSNDLIELLRLQPSVDAIANDRAVRNGRERPGAFRAVQEASGGAAPQLAFQRPYAVDLVGWFDDFSTSGVYDALGGFSRAGLQLNSFTFSPLLGGLVPVPPQLRNAVFSANVATGRNSRCPGSVERPAPDGSNPWKPSPDFNCDATQRPPGR